MGFWDPGVTMRMLHLVKIRQYSVATGCLDEKFGFPAKSKRRLHQYKPDRDTSKQITGSIPPIHNSGSTGAHLLSITVDELMQLGLVALGTQAPSLIIRGANILALHTGELLGRDIVIKGRHVAAITPWNHFLDAEKVIKATGKFVSPVFIDAHIHMEYTNLISGELERLSVPRGTTTVLANANCIVNVFGERGMDFMVSVSQYSTSGEFLTALRHHFESSGRSLTKYLGTLPRLSLVEHLYRLLNFVRGSLGPAQLHFEKAIRFRWTSRRPKNRLRLSMPESASQDIRPCL